MSKPYCAARTKGRSLLPSGRWHAFGVACSVSACLFDAHQPAAGSESAEGLESSDVSAQSPGPGVLETSDTPALPQSSAVASELVPLLTPLQPTPGAGAPAETPATVAAAADASPSTPAAERTLPAIEEVLDIADVWSGQPVNFALVTVGTQQFAAYYDARQQMTVARRALGSQQWEFRRLPSLLGWDSHNHVALALDGLGYLHVAGNMHNVPLIYFRSSRPFDIQSFERVPAMLGVNEASCTYPEFFTGPAGDLIFSYRDGASGNGNTIFNAYGAESRTWRRLLDAPLTNGEGLRNTYPVGPVLGPDGFWHLVWVWRDTADAATNHDLSYARSRDLIHWEAADGRPSTVPITLGDSDIVDAVPAGGGMINNNTKIGFDARGRPLIAYHKYDAAGNTQLYNARYEAGAWVTHAASSWDYRWQFGGLGTIVFEIEVEPARVQPDGTLTQNWYHARYGGRGAFGLDPDTLAAQAEIAPPLPYPRELDQPVEPTPGMVVRWQRDSGAPPEPGLAYLLRWETLESNRDLPRPVAPPASRLVLYGFRQPR